VAFVRRGFGLNYLIWTLQFNCLNFESPKKQLFNFSILRKVCIVSPSPTHRLSPRCSLLIWVMFSGMDNGLELQLVPVFSCLPPATTHHLGTRYSHLFCCCSNSSFCSLSPPSAYPSLAPLHNPSSFIQATTHQPLSTLASTHPCPDV
jgi:hypothetical protein